MVTLQAKQEPPAQQQQQHLHHLHHREPSLELQRPVDEESWRGGRQKLTCDNSNGSNENRRGEVDPREDWPASKILKSGNNEDEVAHFGEKTTSSRSQGDARSCGEGATRNNNNNNNQGNQNGRRDIESREDWPNSDTLKSNNTEEIRERRVAPVANFREETTSSRSQGDARSCGEGATRNNNNNQGNQNGRRDIESREDWPNSDTLKSNNTEETRERRVAPVANFREETTSSRSGRGGESTQCSDLEDDDDDDLEEEAINYQVDEVDSEDEEDDDEEAGNRQIEKSDRWVKKKVVTTRVQHESSFAEGYGQSEVVPQIDETTFGEVNITNSKHVHVGNTNFYKGPVTIKQFVYTNACPVLDKEDDLEGSSSARVSDVNPNEVPIVTCDPNGPMLPSYRDYDTVAKWLWTWRCAAILCVVALISVTLVAVISVLLTKSNVPPRLPNKVPDSPDSGSGGIELPSSVRIIEREFWNAQPPTTKLDKLRESPTPYVIISHTATVPCETQSSCVLRVRLIQTFHIESFGWEDIGYNFLIGGDGLAYVGRGWDLAGAHAFGYNYKSIGISFVGTFNDVAPNALQLNAAQKLIELGLNKSKIAPDYKLLGHRQVSKTLSPGDQLYNILQTWDHWSPVPRPEAMGAANDLKPHPAAVLLILIVALQHLSQILRRSSGIFSRAARTFCTVCYRLTIILYVQ